MGPEQEQRAAEMFASGATEREVAEALGCSASTAHRLRERLAAAEETPAGPGSGTLSDAVDDAMRDGLLAALAEKREEAAATLADLEARAQASRDAIAALEGERLELIGAGKDAAPLRARMTSARDDLADWETAAAMARQNLATADTRIAEVHAEAELAALRAELDAAVAERDRVFAMSGDRQRAAVAAVRAAAEDFCAVFADEDAAAAKVTSLMAGVVAGAQAAGEAAPPVPAPASTALAVPGDATGGPALALYRAITAARAGNVQSVAAQLGEAFGWLPPGLPTAEELEQRRKLAEYRQAELERLRKADKRIEVDEGPRLVGLDHFGRPVDEHGNVYQPRAVIPRPDDVWTRPYAAGNYGPGYRTGL
jgi:Homeodomain-like domain-containing protein